ncbi:hypothetical protein ACIGNX_23940 [Actinosynnema sp. NPDC053489]|uniref:hypothetical protein n=1 Tax=Actinosynnema sp. NPDC053489 TaxID=3363916 RepID=UPI0037C9674E
MVLAPLKPTLGLGHRHRSLHDNHGNAEAVGVMLLPVRRQHPLLGFPARHLIAGDRTTGAFGERIGLLALRAPSTGSQPAQQLSDARRLVHGIILTGE